jgi:trimeric autotransporter adhesin
MAVAVGYGLREVLQLRSVTWNWKTKSDGGRQLGLIAQEVEAVLPELVSTDKDAEQTKGLNYVGLVTVTIKAIQEQQAKIEEQHERITEQLEQLEQQRRQIDNLKELVCLDHPQAAVCK